MSKQPKFQINDKVSLMKTMFGRSQRINNGIIGHVLSDDAFTVYFITFNDGQAFWCDERELMKYHG